MGCYSPGRGSAVYGRPIRLKMDSKPRSDVFSGKDEHGRPLHGHWPLALLADRRGQRWPTRSSHDLCAHGIRTRRKSEPSDSMRLLKRDEGDPVRLVLFGIGATRSGCRRESLRSLSSMGVGDSVPGHQARQKPGTQKRIHPTWSAPIISASFARQVLIEEIARFPGDPPRYSRANLRRATERRTLLRCASVAPDPVQAFPTQAWRTTAGGEVRERFGSRSRVPCAAQYAWVIRRTSEWACSFRRLNTALIVFGNDSWPPLGSRSDEKTGVPRRKRKKHLPITFACTPKCAPGRGEKPENAGSVTRPSLTKSSWKGLGSAAKEARRAAGERQPHIIAGDVNRDLGATPFSPHAIMQFSPFIEIQTWLRGFNEQGKDKYSYRQDCRFLPRESDSQPCAVWIGLGR